MPVAGNLTKVLKTELISRNPAFQFPEDLPEISAEWESHINDEFGFGLMVKGVSFQKLNYLMSLLISEGEQPEENTEGDLSGMYSCKLQKCFGHLTEKGEGIIEILILQDSDEKPIAVEATVNVIEKVSDVLEEVGQEISEIMMKLKAKSKNNEMFDEEFDRLSSALETPLKKSESYQEFMSELEASVDDEKVFKDLPDLYLKLNDLDEKFKNK